MKKVLKELDIFSGIAILCVVLIHSNAFYLSNVLNLQSYKDATFSVRVLDNFVHSAVPMFIFIAGYKYALNNIDNNYKEYVLKKINSVIKPFLIISLIFIIRNIMLFPNYYSIKSIAIEVLSIFIGYNPAYQLWYIPMYIFVTCTYPIIYKLLKGKIRMFVILFLLLLQEILSIKFNILSKYPFNFTYYYLFFEMGLIFYKYNFKKYIQKTNIFMITFCIYLAITVMLNANGNPELYVISRKYLLYPVSIIFYYGLSLKLINSKVLYYLGKNSFYIFLLHEPIICTGISNLFKTINVYNSIAFVFISCILTIIMTIIVYKIIDKTFIRNILFNNKQITKAISD